MHTLLQRLLRKRNIEHIEDLSPEEGQTFDRWEGVLSGGNVDVPRILAFCEAEVIKIETKWKNLDLPTVLNNRLIIAHTIYKAIIDAIKAPDKERADLEKYLQNLLHDPK